METAILSSFDRYTTFSFRNTTLTFRTCDNLERFWCQDFYNTKGYFSKISEFPVKYFARPSFW